MLSNDINHSIVKKERILLSRGSCLVLQPQLRSFSLVVLFVSVKWIV